MAVIRDYYCVHCGTVLPDLVEATREIRRRCEKCGRDRTFLPVCNGGCGSRFRHNDFPDDPLFYWGQTSSAVTAHETDPKTGQDTAAATHHTDGAVIHEADRFIGDGKAERRDRYHHKLLTRAGKNRLYSTR